MFVLVLGDEAAIRDGHRYFKLCCKDDTFQWKSKSNVVQLEQKTVNAGSGYEISVLFVSSAGTGFGSGEYLRKNVQNYLH